MAIEYSKGKRTARARVKVLVSALVGAITLGVATEFASWHIAPLIAWDVAALTYVLWIWTTTLPLSSELTGRHALREDPSRAAADVLVVAASVASLAGVVSVLLQAGHASSAGQLVLIAFGVLSVVVSWSVVHTIFMLRYAELYYRHPLGGVDFNEQTEPAYTDFAYLAFTLGMTFQVSDTSLTSKQFRAAALRHALISYVFGTVIVATTINLIAGLIR